MLVSAKGVYDVLRLAHTEIGHLAQLQPREEGRDYHIARNSRQ